MGETYSRMTSNEDEVFIKDEDLKPIKRYFALTGQYWSFEDSGKSSKAKRILYGLLQVVIACFVAFYFVYTLVIFGPKPYILSYRFFRYPVTTAENCIWELRWLVTGWLGILLTRSIWLETFEKNMKNIDLGENRWKKVKVFSWTLGFALFVMWVATVFQSLIEINFKITRHNALAISIDSLFSLIDRILAFPLFFLFCVTMYVLCCMVEEYRDDIEKWGKDGENKGTVESTSKVTTSKSSGEDSSEDTDQGKEISKGKAGNEAPEGENSTIARKHGESENSARERFRKIKAAIRIAGLSFESYLVIHFLLLVCTFFLGVCACFEQIEVRIAENNYTMTLPFQMPQYARFINFYGNLSFDTDYTIGAPSTRSASMLIASYTTSFTQTEGKDTATGANNTRKSQNNDDIQTKWLKQSMKNVAICSLVKTLESLVLYFLPIGLMVRLQNRLRRVYEVIEDSNVEEQKKKGLLFDDVQVIRRMCKYVKTAHGLKIFGYTVPTFEAFILAAFGPFIVVVTQRLLLHVHMKQ